MYYYYYGFFTTTHVLIFRLLIAYDLIRSLTNRAKIANNLCVLRSSRVAETFWTYIERPILALQVHFHMLGANV